MLSYSTQSSAGKGFFGGGPATALLEVPAASWNNPMPLIFLDSAGAAWISSRRAARIAGVCPRTVARYSASGLLVAKRIDCHLTVILLESLERLTGLTISRESTVPLREPTGKLEPLIAAKAKKRMLMGKPDPAQKSAEGETRRELAKAAGVSHDTRQGERTDLAPMLARSPEPPRTQAAKAAGLGHSTYAKVKVIAAKEKEQSPNA